MSDEHDHDELDQLQEAALDAQRAYRVALRVHLEEVHGLVVGAGDPAVMHQQLHQGG